MKQKIFTLVMFVVFALIANTTFGQISSVKPIAGGTYTYTISGIDADATDTREVRVYYTTNAAPTTVITGTAGLASMTVTGTVPSASTPTVTPGSGYQVFTLPVSQTAFTISVTYGSTISHVASRLWVEIYDGTSAALDCYNTMFLNVTPTMDYSIAATNLTQCPTPEVPAAQKTDGIANTSIITYTVTRTGGTTANGWEFTLTPTQTGTMTIASTVVKRSGTPVAAFSGTTYHIDGGVDVATVELNITNAPGNADNIFTETISLPKEYDTPNAYTGTPSSIDETGNNAANTTLTQVPSIGDFVGN